MKHKEEILQRIDEIISTANDTSYFECDGTMSSRVDTGEGYEHAIDLDGVEEQFKKFAAWLTGDESILEEPPKEENKGNGLCSIDGINGIMVWRTVS